MANSGPGYRAHPGHRITVRPFAGRVEMRARGVLIAASERALELREATYPPVLYLPKADVATALLVPTERQTYCPFKGQASYWSICAGDALLDNAVWGYDQPYDEVAAIRNHVAFYPHRVEITA
jgi:uncharacterized protein (DUF427 family)